MSQGESLKEKLFALVEPLVAGGVSLDLARQEFERQYLIATMRRHGGSVGRSAEALGVHRNTVRNKLSALKIKPADYKEKRAKKKRRKQP